MRLLGKETFAERKHISERVLGSLLRPPLSHLMSLLLHFKMECNFRAHSYLTYWFRLKFLGKIEC